MNKAFKKYGKAKFSSIIPGRLKVRRALRIASASAIGAQARFHINAIKNTKAPREDKSMAIARALVNATKAMAKAMNRIDHPIQARKE